jgi:hypothetical protein
MRWILLASEILAPDPLNILSFQAEWEYHKRANLPKKIASEDHNKFLSFVWSIFFNPW